MGLVFKKIKMCVWFFCGFAIIMLFCSLPLKNMVENYVTVLVAASISLVIIPIYTYFKRRKKHFLRRAHRSVKYDKYDSIAVRFKKSLIFTHFKAEAITAAIYCSVGAFAFAYYFSQRDAKGNVALVSILCSIGAFALIMLIDFVIWLGCIAFYEQKKK